VEARDEGDLACARKTGQAGQPEAGEREARALQEWISQAGSAGGEETPREEESERGVPQSSWHTAGAGLAEGGVLEGESKTRSGIQVEGQLTTGCPAEDARVQAERPKAKAEPGSQATGYVGQSNR
jgi:hypothetical protein